MNWNFRVIEHAQPEGADCPIYSAIHEVYYDDFGKIVGWIGEPAIPYGAGEATLQAELSLLAQALQRPALVEVELIDGGEHKLVPKEILDDFLDLGATRVTVHFHSIKTSRQALEES
jgi:hypothetical protein